MKVLAVLTLTAALAALTGCSGVSSALSPDNAESTSVKSETTGEEHVSIRTTDAVDDFTDVFTSAPEAADTDTLTTDAPEAYTPTPEAADAFTDVFTSAPEAVDSDTSTTDATEAADTADVSAQTRVDSEIDLSDYEGKEVNVIMSENPLRLEGQAFTVKDNEVYVPIVGTLENLLGAGGSTAAPFKSYWDEENLTAKIGNSWYMIIIKAGETNFTVNESPKTAIAPIQQINGQYMLPLISIAKAIDAKVDWDAETGTVSVFYESLVRESPAGSSNGGNR